MSEVDLSDIDSTFDEVLGILDKLDPNIPTSSSVLPTQKTDIKPSVSNRTQNAVEQSGLSGSKMEFQQPIKGGWQNVGNWTESPYKLSDGTEKKNHMGLDMHASAGTPIYPIAPGIVTKVDAVGGPNKLGGNAVFISHYGGKVTSYYAHMQSTNVGPGDKVDFETVIGGVGGTGNANGYPHLHIEVRVGGTNVDPAHFFGSSSSGGRKILASPQHKLTTLADLYFKLTQKLG